MAKYGNLDGTLRTEFYIGKGSEIIGFRTDGTYAEYKDATGPWKRFGAGTEADFDLILVNQHGEVLSNQDGNVLVSG